MNDKTTAIMERIREVCPELMELSFGCRFQFEKNGKICVMTQITDKYMEFYFLWNAIGWKLEGCSRKEKIGWFKNRDILDSAIIIGHPVHLEHLIHVLRKVGFDSTEEWLHTLGTVVDYFELTLTVEENLEQNEVLRNFVYKIICSA